MGELQDEGSEINAENGKTEESQELLVSAVNMALGLLLPYTFN